MVEAGGARRSRGRGRRSRGPTGGRKSYNSKGPTIRVNGDAQQVYAKYMKLAEDASGSGDQATAESLFQHAEHYLRIVNAIREKEEASRPRNGDQRDRDRGERGPRGEKREGRNGGDDGERQEAQAEAADSLSEDEASEAPAEADDTSSGGGGDVTEADESAAAADEPEEA